MYLYFNNQGVLKEIINDEAIRQGNSDINKIYFFIEGADPQVADETIDGETIKVYQALSFDNGVRTFIDVEGHDLTTENFDITTVIKQVPYDKKRELKFFNYWTNYRMFEISVPDDILDNSGTVGCRIQMIKDNAMITLGLVVFNVEVTTGTGQAIVQPDTTISVAEWNWLKKNMLTPEGYQPTYNNVPSDWDTTPTLGSTKPVTSGGIHSALANVTSGVYKIAGTSVVSDLNDLEKSESLNGYVYNMSDSGDLVNQDESEVAVQEGDNVVFIWDNGDWFWDKLSGIIDTSNLVTLNTDQTISGAKTLTNKLSFTIENNNSFIECGTLKETLDGNGKPTIGQANNELRFYDSNIRVASQVLRPQTTDYTDLGTSSVAWKDLYLSGNAYIGELRPKSGATEVAIRTNLRSAGGTKNIGNADYPFGDLYLSGNLSDGTNSISVADIVNGIAATGHIYKHTITIGGNTQKIVIINLSGTVGTSTLTPADFNTLVMNSNFINRFVDVSSGNNADFYPIMRIQASTTPPYQIDISWIKYDGTRDYLIATGSTSTITDVVTLL